MKIILKDGRIGELINHDGNVANVNFEHKGLQQILVTDIDDKYPLPPVQLPPSISPAPAVKKKKVTPAPAAKPNAKKKAAKKKAVAKKETPAPDTVQPATDKIK